MTIANKYIDRQAYEGALSAMASLQESFSDLRADYVAAQETRYHKKPVGIFSQGSGADYHYRTDHDYFFMMECFRYLAANDQVVSQGIRTLIANLIQDGFTPLPDTGDPALNDDLSGFWEEWADDEQSVDLTGERCWHDLEEAAVQAIVVDGDMLLNPLKTGQLQYFEAHRMRSPTTQARKRAPNTIVHGVELNNFDRRVKYWITKEDYDGIRRFRFPRGDFDKYPAWQDDDLTGRPEKSFFHIFDPRRLSQNRGVSMLAPVNLTAGMHDDVQFAKLVQQKIVSYFAFIHEQPEDGGLGPPPAPKTEDDPCDTDLPQRDIVPAAPGARIFGDPGEKITGFSPNVPNPEFFEQSHMLMTFIAVNMDLPLVLLLLDGKETNFSGWRGAMNQAIIRFRRTQRRIAKTLHRHIYRWRIRQIMRQNASIRRAFEVIGRQLFRHTWQFPSYPYVEPLTDVTADLLEVRNTLNSPRRIARRRNLDYRSIARESVEDTAFLMRRAIEEADRINAEFPEAEVGWREIAYPPLAEGVQIALQPGQEQGQDNVTTDSAQ